MNSKKEHYVNDVCPKCKHFIGFTKGRCPCYEQGRQGFVKECKKKVQVMNMNEFKEWLESQSHNQTEQKGDSSCKK